ncbi:MAG: hypothetical protein QOH35_4992 [Acidobacteriaceae bacterium]|jgi:hypothetical protein|nr:hypothetical protein [Acidobacteriaceae bacterium]
MSKSSPQPATIKQRFIACTQSTGRVGKSTVADGLISWFEFAGIPYSAVDTDKQHHTLSDRHAGKVHLFDATASADEFGLFLTSLPDKPALIVDFPSQTTETILSNAEHFQMMDSFETLGIRPTLLIFTADDSTAKDSAYETLEFFADKADYILVENSARFRSDAFKSTALYDRFLARKSPTIVVDRISVGTLNEWDAAQHKLGRFLSLDDMEKLPGLSLNARLEMSGVRNRFLVQCEECAALLIPDPALIKNKVIRLESKTKKRPANRLGNPDLIRK